MEVPQGNVLLSANQWRLVNFGATMVLDWAIYLSFPELFVTNSRELCLDHHTHSMFPLTLSALLATAKDWRIRHQVLATRSYYSLTHHTVYMNSLRATCAR